MSREEIISIMEVSYGHMIHCVEKDGADWTGFVDVYESEYDNEDDERQGASICVKRTDGYNVIVYDDDIESIEIVQDEA